MAVHSLLARQSLNPLFCICQKRLENRYVLLFLSCLSVYGCVCLSRSPVDSLQDVSQQRSHHTEAARVNQGRGPGTESKGNTADTTFRTGSRALDFTLNKPCQTDPAMPQERREECEGGSSKQRQRGADTSTRKLCQKVIWNLFL